MFRHFHRILDDTVINADDAAINVDRNLLNVDLISLTVDLNLLDADRNLLNVDLISLNVDRNLLDVDLDLLDVDPVGITVDRAAIAFCTQNNHAGTIFGVFRPAIVLKGHFCTRNLSIAALIFAPHSTSNF